MPEHSVVPPHRVRERATHQDVTDIGPELTPDQRPGGSPSERTGFGSLPNPSFAKVNKSRIPDVPTPDETSIAFEDGKPYVVVHTREEQAQSFSAFKAYATL